MHLALFTLFGLISSASADRYAGDNNSGTIKFDLGSTLHTVPGDATSFVSELNIDEAVSGKLVVQASSIKTGIGVRDDRMYDFCLGANTYPTIAFEVRDVTGDKDGLKSKSGTGSVNLHGKLTIRSTSRDIVIPATYSWGETGLSLKGDARVNWSEYGVPDPSILISKVEPVLDLKFDLGMKPAI